MNPKMQNIKSQLVPAVPDFYYHTVKKEFLFRQTAGSDRRRTWIHVPEKTAEDFLSLNGVRATKVKGEEQSPAREMLTRVRLHSDRTVQFAGAVAGYPSGFRRMGSFSALITEGPVIPKAVKGDWSLIKAITEGLMSECGGVQLPYLYAWMKLSRRMLIGTLTRGMPALVFCGPKNCGKSFLQKYIITPFLGGRTARANSFMSGGTQFNGDLLGAEHLMLSDEKSDTAAMSRRSMGSMVKVIVADEDQRIRAMYSEAACFNPFWRLTVSLNNELETIMQLPIMDDSMEDKMMLFSVNKFEWPVYASTPEECKAFAEAVLAQIPAFCWYLENEFVIPSSLLVEKDGSPARFGVACYHSPSILSCLTEVSPEFRLLELIHQCYLTVPEGGVRKPGVDNAIRMTAMEMECGLKSDDSPVRVEARALMTSGSRFATLLSRLHQRYPDNVFQDRKDQVRKWVIRDIDTLVNRVVT